MTNENTPRLQGYRGVFYLVGLEIYFPGAPGGGVTPGGGPFCAAA